GDDGRLLRNHGLAAMLRGREEMHQRVASRAEPLELARIVAIRGASFDDDAYAADRGHAVTRGAARRVECRPKTLLGRLYFGEILQPEPELGELGRRDAWQRVAGFDDEALGRDADHRRRGGGGKPYGDR